MADVITTQIVVMEGDTISDVVPIYGEPGPQGIKGDPGWMTEVSATSDGVSGSISIDIRDANVRRLNLIGNATITLTGMTSAASSITFIIAQDATGGRLATFTNVVRWPTGTVPILSTAGGKEDIISLMWDGTNWYGFLAGKDMYA